MVRSAGGSDLEEAKICCQIVEKSAQIYLQLKASGQMNVIEEKWVTAGRKYFLEGYGRT